MKIHKTLLLKIYEPNKEGQNIRGVPEIQWLSMIEYVFWQLLTPLFETNVFKF